MGKPWIFLLFKIGILNLQWNKSYITEYFYIVFKGESKELKLLTDYDIMELLKDIKDKDKIEFLEKEHQYKK